MNNLNTHFLRNLAHQKLWSYTLLHTAEKWRCPSWWRRGWGGWGTTSGGWSGRGAGRWWRTGAENWDGAATRPPWGMRWWRQLWIGTRRCAWRRTKGSGRSTALGAGRRRLAAWAGWGSDGAEGRRRLRKRAGSSWRAEEAMPMKAHICPYLVLNSFHFLGPFESG